MKNNAFYANVKFEKLLNNRKVYTTRVTKSKTQIYFIDHSYFYFQFQVFPTILEKVFSG